MHVNLKNNPTPEQIIADAERRLAENNVVNLLPANATEFSIALTLCSGSETRESRFELTKRKG